MIGRSGDHEDGRREDPRPEIDFRELFEGLSEAVVLSESESGIILDANQAACDLIGMSRDGMLGLCQSQIHPPQDGDKYKAIFQERAPPGQAISGEIRIQRPSGELFLVEASARLLNLSGKRVTCAVFHQPGSHQSPQKDHRQRENQLLALNAIATTIAGSLHLDEILDRALETVLDVMGLQAGTVLLLSVDPDHVPLAAQRGLSDRIAQQLRALVVDQQLTNVLPPGKEAILLNALSPNPRLSQLRAALENEGLNSLAAVPLVAWERGMGTLVVASHRPDRFSQLDLELLGSIGVQIGMAVENASLYQDQRRRLSEMEALRKTTLDITRQLEVPRLLQSIVQRASALVGTTGGALYLYHPEEQELEMVVSHHLGKDYSGTRLKVGEGLSGKVMQTGVPMLVDDYANWESRSARFEGTPFQGVAAVPLKWGDRIVGVVNVTDIGKARRFTDRDLRLLELFASQAAIAIENAQLYEEQNQRYQELMVLHETSLHITSRLDLNSVLDAIIVRAAKLLDGQTAEVYLHRPAQGDLKSAASIGLPRELMGGVLKAGEGVAGKVLQTGEPLIIDDYESWDGNAPGYTGYGFARVVGAPIRYGQELLGVLIVDRPLQEPGFTKSHVNLLNLLASQAAIAIENARLHDETRRRLQELSAIEEIAIELSSTLDFRKVIQLVLDKAFEATPASAGSIDIVAEDRTHLTWLAHQGYTPEVAARYAHSSSTDKGIVGRVARTGKLSRVGDVSEDPDYLEVVPGTRSQLTVPIIIEDAVTGVIVLESPILDGFTQDHADLVQHLAQHAALAMGNAQLYQRLRESEERYRAYVENVPDAIWEADADGRFTYWSPQIENLTGYAPEELLGRSAYDFLIHPDDAEEFRNRLRQMTADGREEYALRHRALHRDGSVLHVEFRVKPVWDDRGTLVRYGGVARDVSAQMRLQAQLIQSAKLSAIGQMISGVAHELNNPLTTVMGYAQLLQAGDLDDNVKTDLQRIYEDALRAQRIVQNLLTFARQKKPQRNPTDINDTIERALTLRAYQLKADHVEIVAELADNLPWTMADGYQLQQVFLNIINNAHQAMVQAGGAGILTIRSELVDGDTIRVTFSDTGPGIPPDILENVFDPFFTTKDVGMGTGLGLSVSHGIVHEHGGHISAESKLGQGAKFVVDLPVIAWPEESGMTPSDHGTEEMHGQQRRILVADDE